MHVAIIPQKISSNEKCGFELFAPKKINFVKKHKLRYWPKRQKTPNLGKIGLPRQHFKANITSNILKCHYICRY